MACDFLAITVGQRFENLKLGKIYILWYLCRISKSMQVKAAHTLTQQLSHDKADPDFPGHLRQCFVMYNVMMLKTSERIFEGLRDFLSHHHTPGSHQASQPYLGPMCTREGHGFNSHMKYMLNLWAHPMFGCLLHVLMPPSSKEVIIDLLFKFLYQHKIFSSPPMIRW